MVRRSVHEWGRRPPAVKRAALACAFVLGGAPPLAAQGLDAAEAERALTNLLADLPPGVEVRWDALDVVDDKLTLEGMELALPTGGPLKVGTLNLTGAVVEAGRLTEVAAVEAVDVAWTGARPIVAGQAVLVAPDVDALRAFLVGLGTDTGADAEAKESWRGLAAKGGYVMNLTAGNASEGLVGVGFVQVGGVEGTMLRGLNVLGFKADLPGRGTLGFDDFEAARIGTLGGPDGPLVVEGAVLNDFATSGPVAGAQIIERVTLDVTPNDAGGAIEARFAVSNWHVEEAPRGAGAARAFDVTRVAHVDFGLDARVDTVNEAIEVDEIVLDLASLGRWVGSLALDGLPPLGDEVTGMKPTDLLEELPKLRSLSLRFEDDGLRRLMIEEVAAEQKLGEAETVTALRGDLAKAVAPYLDDPGIADIVAALDAYLQHGGTLDLHASAKKPLDVMSLVMMARMAPQNLPILLDVRLDYLPPGAEPSQDLDVETLDTTRE